MHYYLIGVGVHRHWKNNQFTYHSDMSLDKGSIVVVPFGNSRKTGIVVKKINKPDFKTKPILESITHTTSPAFKRFMEWFSSYYAVSQNELYSHFFPSYIRDRAEAALVDTPRPRVLPTLTQEQTEAYERISSSKSISILHGVTGSGKTRIYLELINKTLQAGQHVLLLYPEISLTSQLVQQLQAQFPSVLFGHSQLTTKQRGELWNSVAKLSTPTVIAGPRSIQFLPYNNVGLILIDEAHEPSYKQESGIRYSTISTAAALAHIHGARLVLGSATPPTVETKHILDKGGQLVCMHSLAIKNDKTVTSHIIDLHHKTEFTVSRTLSNTLIKAIQSSLSRREQCLLFLNRRGTAKRLLCEHCGWYVICEHCDLPLTFHHDVFKLVCHTCGRKQSPMSTCPICNSKTALKTFGGKAVVKELEQLFPEARIARFDSDTKKSDSFFQQYHAVKSGKYDILVGTQQIVKGLDLPLLSTVGLVDADISLHFPDYSSDERTFQLVAQSAGRVGRGHTNGTVIVQTRQPNNLLFQRALKGDWHSFYELELENRKVHSFPPYTFVAKLLLRSKSEKQLLQLVDKTLHTLEPIPHIRITGPLLPLHQKKAGITYRYVIIQAKKRQYIVQAISELPKEVLYDLDPISLL